MKLLVRLILLILLLACLMNLPYGFFQFARITCCIGFFILCYKEHQRGRTIVSLLCGMAAILFNPIFRIHFSRATWNRLDLYLAIALALWVLYDFCFDPKEVKPLKF